MEAVVFRYLAVVLLVVGAGLLFAGLYAYVQPPVDVARVYVTVPFDYNVPVIGPLLSPSATIGDANVIVSSVYRYDRVSAPAYGVVSSSLPVCDKGLVFNVQVDGVGYGPYCYTPSVFSSAFWTGHGELVLRLNLSPGPHSIRVFVKYGARVLYSRTYSLSVPSYSDVIASGKSG